MALVTNITKTFGDMVDATYFLVREDDSVFSADEVKQSLNIAMRSVYDISFHEPTVIETDTVVGQREYDIPEPVLNRGTAIVYNAILDDEYLAPAPYEVDDGETDLPESYYISGRTIGLIPTPDDVYNLKIVYMKDFVALVDDDDECDFEDIEIDAAIYYAAHLLKMIDEEFEASANFKRLFEETIARSAVLKTGVYKDGTAYGTYGGAE